MSTLLIALILMLAPHVAQSSHPLTIPELLAERETVKRFSTEPSGEPPSMDEVLAKTDVIVSGTLGAPTARLSADERDVLTYFSIHDPVVIYRTRQLRPSIPPPLEFGQLGGTITIDGRTFTHEHHALPVLKAGTRGLFLLEKEGERYVLAGRYYGAFVARDGSLKPLVLKSGFAKEIESASVTDASAILVSRARAMHR